MQKTIRFECQRCGNCCTEPGLITYEDFARIADALGVGRKEFYRKYCEFYPNLLGLQPRVDSATGHCVFYETVDNSGSCKVHTIKPIVCREAPLLIDYRSGVIGISHCKGSDKGPEIVIESHKSELNKVMKFISEYTARICAKIQPETVRTYAQYQKQGLTPEEIYILNPLLYHFFEHFAMEEYHIL